MTYKKKLILLIVAILVATPLIMASMYKIAPVSWNVWGPVNATRGVAISGYDPVAYFELGEAKTGNPSIAVSWKEVKWYFISQEHKTLFETNPEKYAPQFGGYCATAISIGLTANTDPESWHIEGEKLYLFFNDEPKQDYIAAIDEGIIQRSENRWEYK